MSPAPLPPEDRSGQGLAGRSAERRRQLRTLVVLAALVLLLAVLHAGWRNVFPHGWWHLR